LAPKKRSRKTSSTPSELAIAYAKGVTAGTIPAGRYVQLACQRFLDDLKRKRWRYEYRPDLADRAVRFQEMMPHVKGKWAAKQERLVYEPWQCFAECNLFGWVDRKTGLRRFRESYEEVPRKNAKSTRLAARGLYLFAADGEAGAEVYSGATTEKQAYEVFRPAWMMANKLKPLRERFGIEQAGNPKNPGPMYVMDDMSRFETMIGKPGDGASPHAALVDEYHEHETDHMVDAMQTGMGAREQPMLSIITTAGSNMAGPCYEKRQDVIRILEGTDADDGVFGLIYGIDEGDRWDDPASLVKANPNYGVSVFPEFLEAQLAQARRSASKQNAFRTKHLNEWVGARTAWMNMLAWQRQKRELKVEDFEGCPCWAAADLASKIDVAALLLLFLKDEAFYCIPRFYVPESSLQDNSRYQRYVTEGAMIATPGEITDYGFIEEEIHRVAKVVNLQDVAFDPTQATYIMTRLQQDSIPVIEFKQVLQNMSEPMKQVEADVISRKLFHDGNPAMTWMIGNVVAFLDAKEHIYPRKERPANKIDGAVALIMARARALLSVDDSASFNEFIANPVGR
jgi:phage terminase large subunit-like protein